MASIKLKLLNNKSKPTFKTNTQIDIINILIDTGAHSCIRFADIYTSLKEFPDAEETQYVTYISGLGGTDIKICPIYNLPKFCFKDMDNSAKRFTVYNLPVAVYDTNKNYGYEMILGATIFLPVDYAFINSAEISSFWDL